jgi:serine/threonine protein kinase
VLGDRYEILWEAGRGAMGVVYRARDRVLDRAVAVKVILPGAPPARFQREAQLLAKVTSPHVVSVHHYEVLPDGSPMLVMEWVDGRNLHQAMGEAGGRLNEAWAAELMRQTCDGMQVAADLNIVHRDLKPSNILLDREGRARVADFGLARDAAAAASAVPGTMGTPLYMAPEQAEDPHNVDTRADVYSFGATFYHALTGAAPFTGPSTFSVLLQHKTEPLVPPKARNAALTDRVSELIERCLAKSPGDRFSSFAEVRRQLDPASASTSPWDAAADPRLAGYLAHYHSRRDAYLAGLVPDSLEYSYSFPGDRVLRVLQGDITRQEVDAVVSSDDEHLSMGGGVSAAILRAAGPEVEEEARRFTPVRPGRAVVTTAGRMPARFIFHGITLDLSQRAFSPSRDLIAEILSSCLYHADTLNVRSIAFPLLGTGTGGFSRAVCLDTTFRYLARVFLRGVTSVREARIVLSGWPPSTWPQDKARISRVGRPG